MYRSASPVPAVLKVYFPASVAVMKPVLLAFLAIAVVGKISIWSSSTFPDGIAFCDASV